MRDHARPRSIRPPKQSRRRYIRGMSIRGCGLLPVAFVFVAGIACDDARLLRGSEDEAADDTGVVADGSDGSNTFDGGDKSDGGGASSSSDGGKSGSDAEIVFFDGGEAKSDDAGLGPDGGLQLCGGLIGGRCSDIDQSYCNYPRNSCGVIDEGGFCSTRPTSCPTETELVCGCDGRIYSNECVAAALGFDLSINVCPRVEGFYRCGYRYCETGVEYCRFTIPSVLSEPVINECVPLPAACGGTASCACLAGERCANACEALPDGGARVNCSG